MSLPAPTIRRKGRSRNFAERADKSVELIAGTKRNIPPYVLMAEEGLEIIENTAEEILQEIGVEFRGDEDALKLWKNAGADVDGERVRFDKGLLRGIISDTAPKEFVQHSRNPERSVNIGKDNVVFAPAYGMPFVRDLDTGRRYGSIRDFENLVKLT